MYSKVVARRPLNHELLDVEIREVVISGYVGHSTTPLDCYLWFDGNVTPADQDAAVVIYNNHNPSALTTAQQNAITQSAIVTSAYTQASAIPGWAKWSEATALTWMDEHTSSAQVSAITDLTSAKAVLQDMCIQLRALTRLNIAMRNHIWPGLQE